LMATQEAPACHVNPQWLDVYHLREIHVAAWEATCTHKKRCGTHGHKQKAPGGDRGLLRGLA
jgi:hypothetical protein